MSRGTFDKSWLNEDFMKNVYNSPANPEDCQVDWAVNIGDNQGSDILRVKFNGKTVIVKAELEGQIGEIMNEAQAFEKELETYCKFMPLVKEIIGHDVAPVYYPAGRLIVLEDLKPLGFGVNDRLSLLGYKRTMMAVKCLAEFHAAGHVVLKRFPNEFPYVVKNTYYSCAPIEVIMTTIFKGLAKVTAKWPEVSQYTSKLTLLAETGQERVMKELDQETDLYTIVHGDAHSNNILFHKDNQKTPRILDFQLACRNSLALDLIYTFITSVREDVLQNHWNDLLEEYVSTFNQIISKTEVKLTLTLERLKQEIDKYHFYELHAMCTRGAIFLSPEGTNMTEKLATNSLDDLYDSDVFKQRVIKIIKKHCQ